MARFKATQALYQWALSGNSPSDIDEQIQSELRLEKADRAYFRELLNGVTTAYEEIDAHYSKFLTRSLNNVDPVECAVLRIATYEIVKHPELPYGIAINEALNIVKELGGDQGHRFVNSILDKVAKEHRPEEYKARKKGS